MRLLGLRAGRSGGRVDGFVFAGTEDLTVGRVGGRVDECTNDPTSGRTSGRTSGVDEGTEWCARLDGFQEGRRVDGLKDVFEVPEWTTLS